MSTVHGDELSSDFRSGSDAGARFVRQELGSSVVSLDVGKVCLGVVCQHPMCNRQNNSFPFLASKSCLPNQSAEA